MKKMWILLCCFFLVSCVQSNTSLNMDVANDVEEVQSNEENVLDRDEEHNDVLGHLIMPTELFTESNSISDHVYPPAYGYTAKLNNIAIDYEQNLKVLEVGPKWTKVRIEGYVPTWNLQINNKVEYMQGNYYVHQETDLYLTGEELYPLAHIQKGRAVQTKYEMGEWVYVKFYANWDANAFNFGWMKKDTLGSFEDLDSVIGLEIKISADSDTYKILKEDMYYQDEFWGKIHSEDVLTYEISMPGAYLITVPKEDIIFLGDE